MLVSIFLFPCLLRKLALRVRWRTPWCATSETGAACPVGKNSPPVSFTARNSPASRLYTHRVGRRLDRSWSTDGACRCRLRQTCERGGSKYVAAPPIPIRWRCFINLLTILMNDTLYRATGNRSNQGNRVEDVSRCYRYAMQPSPAHAARPAKHRSVVSGISH